MRGFKSNPNKHKPCQGGIGEQTYSTIIHFPNLETEYTEFMPVKLQMAPFMLA
jgi:hypothetical protein